jgi:hypothetical protein
VRSTLRSATRPVGVPDRERQQHHPAEAATARGSAVPSADGSGQRAPAAATSSRTTTSSTTTAAANRRADVAPNACS